MAVADSPSEVTALVMVSATPDRLISRFSTKAAAKMSMIMPVVRAVCRKQVSSIDQLSRPAFQVKNKATTTPSAADSVAVANPVYRLPITMPKITSGGTRCTDSAMRWRKGGRASRGTSPLATLLIAT